MIYLLTIVIMFMSTTTATKFLNDDTNIEINGTEFRGMVNTTIYGRQNFWFINMTRDMVAPNLATQKNTTQAAWEKQHNETDNQLEKNKTVYISYQDDCSSEYNVSMKGWNSNFSVQLIKIIPGTLESEIEFIIGREGLTMARDKIPGYLKAVAYTYDRSAYTLYRDPAQKLYDTYGTYVGKDLDKFFGKKEEEIVLLQV